MFVWDTSKKRGKAQSCSFDKAERRLIYAYLKAELGNLYPLHSQRGYDGLRTNKLTITIQSVRAVRSSVSPVTIVPPQPRGLLAAGSDRTASPTRARA